ncbi:serine phosphatase RsbU (regulator of sigma subunit) [Streptomyces sp. SLBN-118]|uniref:SpoIIE family protein phosphatase n=1 Tax=Streptomyces sp. SLBN-118 TaxID=2768454 RepID=UPI0011545962|nr:SpoIIE family protein phosphatase [Streptomyces sp. SLBN-118]TQK42978.1 serine phosphatase RsbU (regulator of sigma subunit) [Streptomyces sp. SLBN-118]
MRGEPAGEHAGCVTWYRAAGRAAVSEGGAPPGKPNGTDRVPDELALVLAQAAVGAIEAVGGYAGGVYVPSSTPGLLRLAVLAGLPNRLFRPWWRMHVNRPFPVADAHRSGQAIHLGDAEEAMRRYPQLMAGLPYPFGSLYAPVVSGRQKFGVLVVLRPSTPGQPVSHADRLRMHNAAARLGTALVMLDARAVKAVWDGEPVSVQLPAVTTPPVHVGRFDWDLSTGAISADEDLCAMLGTSRADFGDTVDALAARLAPEDAYGLWAVARQAMETTGRPVSRRMRLLGPDGRPHLLELSAHAQPPGDGQGRRLTGFLMDLGTGPMEAEATDRLPRGIFSLDRLGRITYVNQSAETLLGRPRSELSGRVLWDVLPWFGNLAYEDHYRAALLSRDPVHFMARRSPEDWMSVTLYPGQDGLTVTVSPSDQPAYASGSVAVPGAGLGSAADRAAALYRPVALAIALTEAVTARQVSAVVTEELLPAFGGRQLAIYLLSERHLYLAWETGFPQGFLNRFDGVALDARLPGVETLTSGRPIFFESMEHLAEAYPGIPMDANVGARAFLPLIASGRPVGSCILGFDRPRGFSPEERTVLTALAGLIAQALQRAQRYDTEAALARGLQDALLPHRLPVLDQVDTVGRYLPGTQSMEVGGDWYDVVETDRGLALVIGDVQGHGVAAAATMGQLRSAVRAFALSGHDPQAVMTGTNRLLIDLDPGQFASCCFVVLDPATGSVKAVRAGHPQPLVRHANGRTEVLDLPGGVVLGVDKEASYPVTELRLEPGDVLALYTDGLVEQAGVDIDLGVERLRGSLAGAGSSSLAGTADRLMNEARQATDRPDDIALLLAARWTESGTGSPP